MRNIIKSTISKIPVAINVIIIFGWNYLSDYRWSELCEWFTANKWTDFIYQNGCVITDLRASVVSIIIVPVLYVATVLVVLLMALIFKDLTLRCNYLWRSLAIVTVLDICWAVYLYQECLPFLLETVKVHGF